MQGEGMLGRVSGSKKEQAVQKGNKLSPKRNKLSKKGTS